MHPSVLYDLAKIKIAEDLATAERHRRVREAGSTRPRAIDSPTLFARVRGWLRGAASSASKPAGAGA